MSLCLITAGLQTVAVFFCRCADVREVVELLAKSNYWSNRAGGGVQICWYATSMVCLVWRMPNRPNMLCIVSSPNADVTGGLLMCCLEGIKCSCNVLLPFWDSSSRTKYCSGTVLIMACDRCLCGCFGKLFWGCNDCCCTFCVAGLNSDCLGGMYIADYLCNIFFPISFCSWQLP